MCVLIVVNIDTSSYNSVRASYSTMTKCRKFVLVEHFKGWPKETDLKIVEEELPPLKDGGTLSVLM